MSERASRMAEAPGSRTQPARETRAATGFEDREGHRAPIASVCLILSDVVHEPQKRLHVTEVFEDMLRTGGAQFFNR